MWTPSYAQIASNHLSSMVDNTCLSLVVMYHKETQIYGPSISMTSIPMDIASGRDDDIHYMIIPTNFLEWWHCMVEYGQHLINLKKLWISIKNKQHMIIIDFKNQYTHVKF